MTRFTAAVMCFAIAQGLGLATKTMGQTPAEASPGATIGGEKKAAEKKNEPNWQAMVHLDNRSYLANLRRMNEELVRFRKDPQWGDALLQTLGTEYSYVGRHQKALECFDRPTGPRAKAGQLASADRYEP